MPKGRNGGREVVVFVFKTYRFERDWLETENSFAEKSLESIEINLNRIVNGLGRGY